MAVVPIAGKGRGLIATQQIAAGDTVLVEQPIASLLVSAVPLIRNYVDIDQPHCSHCLAQLPVCPSPAVSACGECDAVYCSDEHKRLHSLSHHSITCGYYPPSAAPSLLLETEPVPPVPAKFPIMASQLLSTTLVQMLLPASHSSAASPPSRPRLWDDIGRLCHAELDSALLTNDYQHLIQHVSHSLHRHPQLATTTLDTATLSSLLPLSLYARLVALLHLNCFSVYTSTAARSPFATALFVHGALLNHSCSPNVELQQPLRQAEHPTEAEAERGEAGRVGVWLATRDVAVGEELCNTYTDVSVGVKQRRDYLEWAYGFVCQCERCKAESGE